MRTVIGDEHTYFFGIDTIANSPIYPFILGGKTWVVVIAGLLLVVLGFLCLWYGFALIQIAGCGNMEGFNSALTLSADHLSKREASEEDIKQLIWLEGVWMSDGENIHTGRIDITEFAQALKKEYIILKKRREGNIEK